MSTQDGGPAFPLAVQNWDGVTDTAFGMTLRDWFATYASEKDIEEHTLKWTTTEVDPLDGSVTRHHRSSREQARYSYADAMLRAREGK